VDFCISLAKRTPDPQRLATVLEGQGLPRSSETQQFARDLLSRLPCAAVNGGISSYKQQEQAAAAAARKNESYGLLLDDDEHLTQPASKKEMPVQTAAAAGLGGGRAGNKKQLRRSFRDDKEGGDSADGGAVRRKSRKRVWEEDGGAEGKDVAEQQKEEERTMDAEEKAEFERRLKERDAEKTRKLAERRVPKEELEEMRRRRDAEEAEDRLGVVHDLRKISRQEYLKKREEAKLEELKEALEDEKYLFQDQKMTEKERKELAYKEEVYRIAVERKKQLDELERDGDYHMPAAYDEDGKPSGSRYEVLTARYRDVEDEKAAAAETPWAQQEAFEAEQIKKALTKVGRTDAKAAGAQYDFVFEDQINFIVDSYLKGEAPVEEESKEERLAREREEREQEKRSAFEKIQDDRRNLPMYPYREPLLKAIEEHQIIIIVGETGSGR